jgi:hypothetical protein
MNIKKATLDDRYKLLDLMHESSREIDSSPDEWVKTETAILTLLQDSQAGEAYLIFDQVEHLVGYIIMCRGFSLDYGGYFTWVEETYIKKADRGRFRDQRFSP